MKKFLVAALIGLLIHLPAAAKVEVYEGTDEYYVLGAVENINVARERAREKALRVAREKAGIYLHTVSKVVNMKLIDDEIISLASGVLRVLDTGYETVQLPDTEGYLVRATVKAEIDTGELETFLLKDEEEMSRIIAGERAARLQEERQAQLIETLKQRYAAATTPEERDAIAAKIVGEDNVFLSNLKLREGNKLRDEGNYKQAAKFFTEAIELNPANILAWNNRGWAYVEQRRYDKALADFDKVVELKPDSELAYFGRGRVYNQQGKYEAAIREYDKGLAINPKYAIAWNNRGTAKSWLNRMTEAIADYDKAIALKPNYARAYENRGKAYIALGDYDRAAADRDRAEHIKWSNEHADKIIEQALALNERGKFKAALKLLDDAAKLYPDNQFVFVNRGTIYNDHLHDYDAAIADYNRTIKINAQFSWPYHNRAVAYGRLKRWEDAVVDYGRAIDLDPNYASAYNGRAWSYCQIGQYEAALVDANKALSLKPNEANYLDTRACAYIGLKRYRDALADLDKAIVLSPEGWLYFRRGELYRLIGDEAKAQADFDKARRLGYDK